MQLHPDLSFCRIDDRFLFLDLARDRYFALGKDLGDSFARLIDGSAAPAAQDQLTERGLLVASQGRPIEPCPGSVLRRSLLDDPLKSPPVSRVLGLAWRFARMRTALRRRGIAAAANTLAAARRTAQPFGNQAQVATSAAAYDRLCLIRGAHDLCLPHSLALAFYLARRGIAAEVVLGVQLRPFSAHCWVEYGDSLVNDRFDRVRLYTPIRRL